MGRGKYCQTARTLAAAGACGQCERAKRPPHTAPWSVGVRRLGRAKFRAHLEFALIWVCFGFVFQARVIVFNNLLASFVQITSFLHTFCPRRLVLEVVMLIPLCGRSISQCQRCEAEEGDRSLPPRMTGARPRPRACSGGPRCRHAFLLFFQIP